MRKNFPVTETEYHMQDGKPIVSKTDLKGRITYINPYFVEVSGFEEAELIGAPHNMIRHPDMPAQAFEDMWRTLKGGLPWSAMVKNRRKNGDYYWVLANATPLIENGAPAGYLSVRTKPTRAQVEQAETLYRAMREERADVVICRGQLVKKGWRGGFQRLLQLSLARTVATLVAGALLLFLALGSAALALVPGAVAGLFAILAVLGALWTLTSAYVLQQAVVRPLEHAGLAARALAGGDLTFDVDGNRNGQMGLLLRALRQTSVNLRAVIGDVGANVETVNIATGEIAAGNMDLSSRTEAQASNLEETAASMEELSSTVRQNADNAQEARQLVASSTGLAAGGSDLVARMGSTMGDIATSSGKIKDIISMIDGIAFQTNILALNAAVEAARAGEHGRGFAVVAGEVRNLAQRAAGAAKDIKLLIDESVANVNSGTGLVHEAAASMQAILASVRRVETFVSDIAVASAEQSSGIEQINQAVMQMEDVTQQNAAMVEEAAAASERLNEQAAQVVLAMSLFKTRNGQGELARAAPVRLVAETRPASMVQGGAVARLGNRVGKRLALPG